MRLNFPQPLQHYHLSPWPILLALWIFIFLSSLVLFFHYSSPLPSLVLLILILIVSCWSRDLVRETTYMGFITSPLKAFYKKAFILIIISEIMIFGSFFASFFYLSLVPDPLLGGDWPPIGITPIPPHSIPLLGTILLLTSSVAVTWAHHELIQNQHKPISLALTLCILLGLRFLIIQLFEFYQAPFTIQDTAYGRIFFLLTGCHGSHVFAGLILLSIMLLRERLIHYSPNSHTSFILATWYWHFVDAVWLFVYVLIYWWCY